MNSFRNLSLSILILVGLTSTGLAEPYSHTWEQSNTGAKNSEKVSSDYTLGWQDVQKAGAPADVYTNEVEAPVVVNVAELPALIAAARAPQNVVEEGEVAASSQSITRPSGSDRVLRGPSNYSVPVHNITVRTQALYDYYTSAYRYVYMVEVVTHESTGTYRQTYWNTAQWKDYDVYLKNLKAGDRYEVRVTWDDGQYTILNNSVERNPYRTVYISSP